MSRNRFLLGLALIVLLFLAVAGRRYSPDSFGSAHDDSLYFSSAKSISEGRGYRLASMPGEPPQTKYPAAYAALLSLAWKMDPVFPDNLAWAWRLNMLCAALALLAAAALLRQLGCSRPETLALAALTAVQPYFVYWSNHLVSDLLFMALALGAATLAHRELSRNEAGWAPWLGMTALLALACMTRTVGAAFVAGVAVAALGKGAWTRAAVALAGAAPVAYGLLSGAGRVTLPASADALPGFRRNLLYYTSYIEHWKDCVPSWDVYSAQAQLALTEALKHPAIAIFQLPAAGFVSMPLALVSVAISVGIAGGVVLRARRHGLHPVHVAAIAYLPIVLSWNYLLMDRFWLPFLPLFLAGASHELVRIARATGESWRKSPAGDRVVVAAFGSALAALVAFAAYRGLWRFPGALARLDQNRAQLEEPKREAYRWLIENSDPADAIVSNDDATAYLYTERRGMRPLAPSTESFFMQSQELLDRDLEGMTDTAAGMGARYWITAPDDFEMTHAPEDMRAREAEALASAPLVFTSSDGRVEVRDVSSMPWNRTPEVAQRSGEEAKGLK